MIRHVMVYDVIGRSAHEVSGTHLYSRSLVTDPLVAPRDGKKPDTFVTKVTELPIHHVINGQEDCYIAMHPKLKELLECPIRDEVKADLDKLRNALDKSRRLTAYWKRECQHTRGTLREAQYAVSLRDAFNDFPTISKLWFILKGGKV